MGGSNYAVVPELSLGQTQKVIISDESTLCREMPTERIFGCLRLIVNCNAAGPSGTIYKAGSCSSDKRPDVIYERVEQWATLPPSSVSARLDRMQDFIWTALSTGTVAL